MRGHTTEAEMSQRSKLYRKGLTDQAIGKIVGVDRKTITAWRAKHGLPSKNWRLTGATLRSSEEKQAMMELWKEGLNDCEIARRLKATPSTIFNWRRRNGLATHGYVALTAEKDQQRRGLYEAGLTDGKIARAEGIRPNNIAAWRAVRSLPQNHASLLRTTEGRAKRNLLYQLGWSDRAIAQDAGVATGSIKKWRDSNKLEANSPSPEGKSATIEALVKRVRRAVGRYLPRDIADDTTSELCLAMLDGRLSLDKLEAEARRYGNRTLERFANKYLTRSVDEEIGEDGFTLLDTMRDESSSSWLEEMGATVW